MPVQIFTSRSIETMVNDLGGTAFWRIDAKRVSRENYVLLFANSDPKDMDEVGAHEAPGNHGELFAIGEIRDAVRAEEGSATEGRCLIRLKRIADVRGMFSDEWPGYRNPTVYSSDLPGDFDPDVLDWQTIDPDLPLPKAMIAVTRTPAQQSTGPNAHSPLTIAEAKQRLAETLGVEPDQIEITIRA